MKGRERRGTKFHTATYVYRALITWDKSFGYHEANAVFGAPSAIRD